MSTSAWAMSTVGGPTSAARARLAPGASEPLARPVAFGAMRWWHYASLTVHRVVTKAHADRLVVPRLTRYPQRLELPDADPHVRWRGRDRQVTIPIRHQP